MFAFVVLLFQFSVPFTPPDPFTQLIVMGIAALVSIPVAVVFVRQSYSLERLYGYLLAMQVLVYVVFVPVFGLLYCIGEVTGVMIQQSGVGWTVAQTLLLLVVYALAFHLVYRGGYTRLKARFA